jgi:hypothetical protein
MLPPYNDAISPDQNLEALADSCEHQARQLSGLPSRSGEVESLTLRARAAREGHFLHDPRSISGCDPAVQIWRARCAAVGRIVSPSQFWPDGKAPKREPIKVVRGR